MATGISLHIGLNYVDPSHYSGWDGKLNGCEYDAADMYQIAASQGFKCEKLIRREACREAVIEYISSSAQKLKKGDIFFLSYSGHGGQLPDLNGDEEDGQDETWCLYDGELLDDELKALWSQFSVGVRILVISDSCHSGTVVKTLDKPGAKEFNMVAKFMPPEVAASTYFNNRAFYEPILKGIEKKNETNIKASVKLISGCQDNQNSYDGIFNGQFTAALKIIWNGAKFSGNYAAFHQKILNRLPERQSPNLLNIGKPNSTFNQQTPFKI